jgi:hypothetical protein
VRRRSLQPSISAAIQPAVLERLDLTGTLQEHEPESLDSPPLVLVGKLAPPVALLVTIVEDVPPTPDGALPPAALCVVPPTLTAPPMFDRPPVFEAVAPPGAPPPAPGAPPVATDEAPPVTALVDVAPPEDLPPVAAIVVPTDDFPPVADGELLPPVLLAPPVLGLPPVRGCDCYRRQCGSRSFQRRAGTRRERYSPFSSHANSLRRSRTIGRPREPPEQPRRATTRALDRYGCVR